MISFGQNQANAERDQTVLTTFEVFSKLMIQVLFCGAGRYFAHGCREVDNMTFFVSVTLIRNDNSKYL